MLADGSLGNKGGMATLHPSQIQELVIERRHIRRLQVCDMRAAMHQGSTLAICAEQ